jgi:hypothetical protein
MSTFVAWGLADGPAVETAVIASATTAMVPAIVAFMGPSLSRLVLDSSIARAA